MTKPVNSFVALIKRDCKLAWGQGGSGAMILSFFMVAVSLFPFAVGPEGSLLSRMAPGIILVVALLASLISLDRLFQADFEDGSLDQWVMSNLSLSGVVLAKILAHWISCLVPLIVLAPAMGLLVNLPLEAVFSLFVALLVASPAFSCLGAVGAALTVALRRGGVLISLLVLPLYIPSLIFTAGAVEAAVLHTDSNWVFGLAPQSLPHMALALAVSLLAFVVALPASVAAIKLSME